MIRKAENAPSIVNTNVIPTTVEKEEIALPEVLKNGLAKKKIT